MVMKMKTYSNWQLPQFQVSAHEVRIHWNSVELPPRDDDATPQYEASEALCLVADSREDVIAKISASAAENGEPDDFAEALADAWIAHRDAA
jgi:hypothetical protein